MAAAGPQIVATQDPISYGGAPALAEPVQRKGSRSTESLNEKESHPVDHEAILAKDTEDVEAARSRRQNLMHKVSLGRVPSILQ
jgi:hypothetical protein